MKREIEETIINNYDENHNLLETKKFETVILIPEEDEAIRNKLTDEIIYGIVGLGTNDNENNYEVVEIPKE